MKQLRGLYKQTFFTFRTYLVDSLQQMLIVMDKLIRCKSKTEKYA